MSSLSMGEGSAVPPDSAEVSATAQALLQAHRERSAKTSDGTGPLHDVERSIAVLDTVCKQLQSGSALGQQTLPPRSGSSGTVLQPMGEVAFWPARVVDPDQVYVRQLPSGLSLADELALERTALPLASSSVPSAGQNEVVVQARLSNPSRTLDVKYVKTNVRDARSQLEARRRRLQLAAHGLRLGSVDVDSSLSNPPSAVEPLHMVNEQNEALNEEGLPFFEPMERLPDLVEGETASAPASAYLQPFVPTNTKLATDKKERQKWMDDVFSKLEQEEDQEEGSPSLAADSSAKAAEDPVPADQEFRVVLRKRTPSPPPEAESDTSGTLLPAIVSATRPPPPKGALKNNVADRPPVVQRPSFGSTGIRRGFLNLNPSSPGALQSSYTQEELENDMRRAQEKNEERQSRSPIPTPLTKAISSVSPLSTFKSDDVGSSPIVSGTSTPNRKSVRIKSPERAHPDASDHVGLTPLQRALKSSIRVKEKDLTPQPSAQPQTPSAPLPSTQRTDSGSGTVEKRHKDDIGVEQEAEKIISLLGPAVVEGHPSAPPSDLLRKMQEAHEQDQQLSTPEAIAERAKREEEERRAQHARRLQEKPALGQAVMERPASSSKSAIDKNGKSASAFKRGFLNQKPDKFVPNKPSRSTPLSGSTGGAVGVPKGPTESLGMSALERASMGDDNLEKRRVEMGLPAAVPHARPSKAYAEKIQRKQAGREPDSPSNSSKDGAVTDGDVQMLARPKAGDDVPRPGRVRFGAPSSSHDAGADDDEGEMAIDSSAQLDNHGEEEYGEVDEEQEEPKITGEGADADDDEDDEYFDSYLDNRAQQSADAEGEQDEDDLDWDIPTDDEIDEDDFDYDREDLLALAPDMDADTLALSENDDLVREYAQAKARLQALGLSMPGSNSATLSSAGGANADDVEEDDYVDDVVPLDATVDDPKYQGNTSSSTDKGSRISRFKKSLGSQRPSSTTPSSAQELATMFQSARNLGQNNNPDAAWKRMDGVTATSEASPAGAPLMVIPQLAPVRYPKNGQALARDAGKPVDLDGESSGDDDVKAELNMRSRLDRLEWKQNNPEQAQRLAETRKLQRQLDQGIAPPHIAHRQSAQQEDNTNSSAAEPDPAVEEDPQPKPKKVSRFKASRMA